jgi:hypothetical protein
MADISEDTGLPHEAVWIALKGVRGDWLAGSNRVCKVKNWMAGSKATV